MAINRERSSAIRLKYPLPIWRSTALVRTLYKENGIDAAIVLGVVRHLRVLSPDDLARGGHQAEVGAIHLDDRPLCDHAERGVQRRLRILFDADEVELERGLELGVRHVRLFEAERRRPDEALEFWRLPCERLADEGHLVHHPLPLLLFTLARLDDLEDLVLGHRPHLGDRHVPLARLLFALLLDRVGENLCMRHALAVEQVGGHGVLRLGRLLRLVLVQPFGVLLDRLLHLSLLSISLLIVHLGAQPAHLRSILSSLVSRPRLLLPRSFLMV
mmetsp:Transcript_31690/g.69292  ORF Transcript_31690/g.69292 Transcript_31690/m.69292 type:complete len:273 (-) Transcript_31690:60-878(-)